MGMAIDLARCVGCQTCAISCKQANNTPSGNWWNRVLTVGGQEMDTGALAEDFRDSTLSYLPFACQHCENPACVRVCPVGATYKREEDGVVFQDYDKCIGCRMCMAACPYTGVRSFNWEDPQFYRDFPLGDAGVPTHQKHTVEKCTFCSHRLAAGEEPACMVLCPLRARYWGDLDDPASEVCRQIASREHKQLLPERGTRPAVYYLM
jgi:molybdopterin-containing oxidoreductase family iron-sulfur binding subunit